MNWLNTGLYMLFICVAFLTACSDPTVLGADLLEEDQSAVGFSDTFMIKATTIESDSVRTYSPGTQLRTYLLGEMNDPFFGTSRAELYVEPRLPFLNPDFTFTKADSLVLVLPYDTSKIYGSTAEPFGIEVFELMESMDRTADYYSDATFLAEMMPLGSFTVMPVADTARIVDYSQGLSDTILVTNQFRMALDPALATDLIRLDSAAYASDSAFVEAFKGLYIKPTTSNEGMLALDLFNDANAGLYLYYTKNDTVPQQIQYQLNPFSAKVVNFSHDNAGTVVGNAVNDADSIAEFVFVQGMAGVDTKIELPDLSFLKNTIINKAELELRIAPFEDDKVFFTPISQLILAKDTDDGIRTVIDDIAFITLRGLTLSNFFGGDVEAGTNGEPDIYRMNLSAHIQSVVDGVESNILYISAFPKAEEGGRSIIYGNHPDFGIKLKIAFTEL